MGSLTIKNKVLRCEKCFMLKKVIIEPNYPQSNVSCECSCGVKKDSIVNFTKELQKEEQFKIKCNFCGKEPHHPSYCTGCRRTYCSTCIKSHDTKIATRTPHLVIDSFKYDFYCSKHQDELVSAYCKSCNLNICQKCIDEKLHKAHRFVKYAKYLLSEKDLSMLKIHIKLHFDKVDENAQKAEKLIPYLTDGYKIKELKDVCESSVRDNKAILVLVKYFYKMYKHAKHRNFSMIFNVIENMKFNPLNAPTESAISIEKRRLNLVEFYKRDFVIFRRFAASKRRSKTTAPNKRTATNEDKPKDDNQKDNLKVPKIEDDVGERKFTALSKEFELHSDSYQIDPLGGEKTDNIPENLEIESSDSEKGNEEENIKILLDSEGEENDKKDINDNNGEESTPNNDNNVEKDENNQDKENKEGETPNIKENETKDEEKKEDNEIKDNEAPKKKEINFKVDDKIKNKLNFLLNKDEEEKKESKVIDIRKLCAEEIEQQKKDEKKREELREEKLRELKEEEKRQEKLRELKEEEKKQEKIEEIKEEEKKEEIVEEKKEEEKKEEEKKEEEKKEEEKKEEIVEEKKEEEKKEEIVEEKKEEEKKEEEKKEEEKKEEEKKEEKEEEKKEEEKKEEEKKVEIKEEKKEEKKVEIKEEKEEKGEEIKMPARIRRISNKTIILHLTGMHMGMPNAPKTPEQIAKEEEEERKRKEEEAKKREEELAKKKIEDQDRQKRVKKALLRIKTKKLLQPENKNPNPPPPQPNIADNPKFMNLAKAMGNKIIAGEPLLNKKMKDKVGEIIMNKPMDAGNTKKKKPKKVGFSDNGNDTDEEGDEDENNNNN